MATPTPAAATNDDGFITFATLGAVSGMTGTVKAHSFVTNNTKAEVEVAGYFNNLAEFLSIGDLIFVSYDRDGTQGGAFYIVQSATADVTIVEASLGVGSTGAEIDAVCDQSARGCIEKVAAISLTATELGGSETNTSFTFPANGAIYLDAWVNVTDNEAAASMDVGTQGTSNDPDGILDGVSLATAGYVGQTANVGALRGKFIAGGDPVSVTASGDLDSCEATLYIRYLELVTAS